MCRVCSRLCPVFPVWSPLFPVFPIESRVANVFPLVPCFSYFSPSVSRLFLVFWVGNLWEATSCRANTINTETVSIAYSVPSSQCVPNCVLCSLWVSFSLFSQCVPSVFPIVYSVPSFYCSQYVSSVSPLWSPLFVVYIPSVYVPFSGVGTHASAGAPAPAEIQDFILISTPEPLSCMLVHPLKKHLPTLLPFVFPMFPVHSLKSLFKRKTLFSVRYN